MAYYFQNLTTNSVTGLGYLKKLRITWLILLALLTPAGMALANHNEEHIQFEQSGFFSVEVKPGIHMISEGVWNCVLIVTKRGAILIDAPAFIGLTKGKTIVDAIKGITDHPVTEIIYSHSHSDHIGSAGLVLAWMQAEFPEEKVKIYAHENTRRKLLDENAAASRPLPTKTFAKKKKLKYRGVDNRRRQISLVYLGTNHSDDNLFIHLPADNTLVWVDVVNPGGIPFGIEFAQSLPGHIRSHEQALGFNFDTHIPGHHGIGTREFIKYNRIFLADLAEKSLNALFALFPLDIRFGYPFNTPDQVTDFNEDTSEDLFARAAMICVEFMTDPATGNADLATGIWELTKDGTTYGPLGGVTPAALLNDCGAMTINLFTLGFPLSLEGVGGTAAQVIKRLKDL